MNENTLYDVPVFRLQLVKEGSQKSKAIRAPEDVAEFLHDVAISDREQMVAIFLNTKNVPIGRHVVSMGTLNTSLFHPRETLKGAILANANGIILSHNHPSGEVSPSKEDDNTTQMLAKACKLMCISLLDHVILSPTGSFYSYQQQQPEKLDGGTES